MAINKKIVTGVLIAIVLVFGLVIGWIILQKEKIPSEEITGGETEVEKQLRELEGLRAGVPPLTEEETQRQLEELGELREEVEALSREETQKQLEELEELRQ